MDQLTPFFRRSEFECGCGCGFDVVDVELLSVLMALRDHYQSPVVINSACRCKRYNTAIRGSEKSQHLVGKAADIVVTGVQPSEVQERLRVWYPDKYGIGHHVAWTHIDVRPTIAEWSY